MSESFLYLLENAIAFSPDALLMGIGYWFLRFSTRKWIGILPLLIYAGATANMLSEQTIQLWGLVMAAIGIIVAECLGRLRRRKRLDNTNQA